MEMFGFGVALREQQFRSAHPQAAEPAIESTMIAWMRWRPGAEFGDAGGRPIELPPT
jgi:hypothetical protein